MDKLTEPIIGRFYTYDHSDYTNIALHFRRVRDQYYFIEFDNGGDWTKLWFNSIGIEEFHRKYEEQEYNKDSWYFECFFNALENLRTNHIYEYCSYPKHELTYEDYRAIDNAVSIFRVTNHITDEYGDSRTNYDDYIKSPQWRQIRAMMLNKYGKCQLCSSTKNLEVHHNSYDHIGEEKEHLEDLVVLCHDCHSKFHNKH